MPPDCQCLSGVTAPGWGGCQKNGNIRLTFDNEAEANAFTTFYDLKLTD